MIRKITSTLLGILFLCTASFGVNKTFTSGSYIINMGITPQTVANGLKPYGFIYEMLKTYNVPVYFVVNQAKSFDGIDFTHNSVAYKGGTFIIDQKFLAKSVGGLSVSQRITTWQGLGMVGAFSVSALTVDVTYTLNSAPFWTLDAQNGKIAVVFMQNAGIPSTAYKFKIPSDLDICDDIFVMPHADPTWAIHSNLRQWNRTKFGAIWAGCHAVSALEALKNGADSMNFLTTKGLVLWTAHGNGTPPYIKQFPVEPAFQYMGKTDLAHQNGSEQIFMPWAPPANQSRWRIGTFNTKIGVYDANPVTIFSGNSEKAAVDIIGRGFGLATSGLVCYQGGHNIAKETGPDFVAAQRIYFNFSFQASTDKVPTITPTFTMASSVQTNVTNALSVTTSSAVTTSFTYQWSSTPAGTFSAATSPSTNWTPTTAGDAIVTVLITDPCGRATAFSQTVKVVNTPSPPTANNDVASLISSCSGPTPNPVTINVLANDTDPDGDILNLTAVSTGNNGTWSANTENGTVTYQPNAGFTGAATATYTVCDPGNLCTTTGTITVNVGNVNAQGCMANEVFTYDLFSEVDVVVGTPGAGITAASTYYDDIIDNEIINFTTITTAATGEIIYQLTDQGEAGDTLTFYMARAAVGTAALAVSVDDDNSGTYTSAGNFTETSASFVMKTYILTNSVNFVKFVSGTGDNQNARLTYLLVSHSSCQTRFPIANPNAYLLNEDTTKMMAVLDNDVDNAGSALRITNISTQPLNGKVGVNTNNTLTYFGNKDFSGKDSFYYNVCNAEGYCSIGKVNVTITDDGCGANLYKQLAANTTTATFRTTNVTDATLDAANKTTVDNGAQIRIKKKDKSNSATRNGVIRFDVSTIPTTAGNISANLLLYNETASKDGNFLFKPLTQTFVEAQTTWNNRITSTAWTTAGGTVSANTNVALKLTKAVGTKTINISGMTAVWVGNSANNYGVWVQCTDRDFVFTSTSGANSNNRPGLAVTYNSLSTVCVAIPNHAPAAQSDVYTLTNSGQVVLPVTTNDADFEGTSLTVSAVDTSTPKIRGVISLRSGGNITFTPYPYFVGTTQFRYTISDGVNTSSTTVYITSLNKKPVAVNDAVSTQSGSAASGVNVITNDSDPDGPAALFLKGVISGPNNGTIVISSNTITYTPANSSFTGKDTIQYVVSENASGGCSGSPLLDTAILVVTVTNRTPTPANDTYTINECTTTEFNVTVNDTDPEGGALTLNFVSVTENPGSGAVSQPATTTLINNKFRYVPTPNYNGTTIITYTVTDNGVSPATSGNATATITVVGVPANFAPTAVDDKETINQGEVFYFSVADNDTDPENAILRVRLSSSIQAPTRGTISLLPNGLILYTPTTTYFGKDSFEYIIRDTLDFVSGTGCTSGTVRTDIGKVVVTIERTPPISFNDSLTALNPGGTNGIQSPNLKGSDATDGNIGTGGKFVITTLPSNGILYYNNVAVTVNQTITSYDPTKLTFDPNFTGAGSSTFTFQTINSSNLTSLNFGTIKMDFTSLSVSGKVFDDANAGSIDGTGINNPGGSSPLYAYLLDGSSNVLFKQTVANDGTFAFTNLSGGTNYPLVISTSNVAIGVAGPAHNLPTGWVPTAEQFGTGNSAGSGIEGGTANMAISVITTTTNVTNVNFGINNRPTAHAKSYSNLPSTIFNTVSGNGTYPKKIDLSDASGTTDGAVSSSSSSVYPGKLSGFDSEDGKYAGSTGGTNGTLVLTQLPNSANTVLVYDGIVLIPNPSSGSSMTYWNSSLSRYEIPNFDATKLSAYFSLSGQTGFDFRYAFKDAGGLFSTDVAYVVSSPAPVPVKLISFTAEKWNMEDVLLKWSTASEINNSHFEVERSADVRNWTKLGEVVGNGTTTQIHNYKFIDALPLNGENYYRLKQVDFDGAFEYTEIRIVSFLIGNKEVLVYPNPTHDVVNVTMNGLGIENVKISLTDMTGRILIDKTFQAADGKQLFEAISLKDLETGYYQLTVTTNSIVKTIKVLKY